MCSLEYEMGIYIYVIINVIINVNISISINVSINISISMSVSRTTMMMDVSRFRWREGFHIRRQQNRHDDRAKDIIIIRGCHIHDDSIIDV